MLSTATGGRAEVVVRGQWREPLNLYLVVAMPPGSGKSPAFRMMCGPVFAAERQMREAARENILASEVARDAAVKKVPGVWRRGAPAKLGPAAGAGGHGPALLATGVLPVRQAGAVTGSRVAGGGSAVQLVRQFLV